MSPAHPLCRRPSLTSVAVTVFAGFHTDLNFLTIHGRSRFPGLHIWARNTGKRITVKLPPGCLLVQAGKQLEHYTGGFIQAGHHEVVCTRATLDALERRRTDPATAHRPQIRISSTFFWHLSSDETLSPRRFRDETRVSEVVQRERAKIEVAGGEWPDDRYAEGMKVGTLVQVRRPPETWVIPHVDGALTCGRHLALGVRRRRTGGAQAHCALRRIVGANSSCKSQRRCCDSAPAVSSLRDGDSRR